MHKQRSAPSRCALHILTDGSYVPDSGPNDDGSGWSLAVIVVVDSVFYFAGCLFHEFRDSGAFIEDLQQMDSGIVENTAVLWAILWALSVFPSCPVFVEPD